jgi:diaminopimelate epimerase
VSARLRVLAGAGNRFALLDGVNDRVPADPGPLARSLCAPRAGAMRLDGLLLVLPGTAGGDVRMQLVNADGSLAETCGNGLRCTARFAVEERLVRGDAFTIEDASGLHVARVERADGVVRAATVTMRQPRILTRDERVELEGRPVVGARIDVGNPHFVVRVDDVACAPVRTDGPRIEKHPAFPAGTNVEFVAARGTRAEMRVWERGVGETEACGSGACAAAAALVDAGLASLPLDVELPGGVLRIDRAADGAYTLHGTVDDLGSVEVPEPADPRPARR